MKRNDEFLIRNVGEEYLLVPLGSQVKKMNGIVILNKTGRFLWELLEQDMSINDLAVAVAEKFEIDQDRAKTDVCNFLDMNAHIGFVL